MKIGCLPWHQILLEDDKPIECLPELLRLRGLVEHTDWHDDDPFQQTLRLRHWLQRLPDSLLETLTQVTEDLSARLASRVNPDSGYALHDLLVFAALIHDVGKHETYESQPDGTTRCQGHEAVSARLAPTICTRFDFTPQEKDLIVRLVTGHGEPYALFKRIVSLTELEREEHLRRFEEDWGDDLLFLLLLAYGDLVTSHLESRRPEKYQAILSFYQAWLQKALGRPSSKPPNAQGRQHDNEA
jgi:hypothetical protein